MPAGDDLFRGTVSTVDALLRIRKRLLDLTTKNRLLHFRWSRGRVVRAVHVGFDGLYAHLKEGGSLLFRPVPEPRKDDYQVVAGGLKKPEPAEHAAKLGIDTRYELLPTRNETLRHIQTLLYGDDLERVLRNIDRTARTAIEESGTNMLYLTFGFLEWFENTDAPEPRYAPLVTMPVTLKRVRHNGRFLYEIAHTDEDIADNLTLREKLRQEFALDLPTFDEEEAPSAYFTNVARMARVRVEPPWRIKPQVSLGLLSFGNLLMYLDLDPTRWPQGRALDQSELVKSLFEGRAHTDGAVEEASEYAVEEDPRAVKLPLVFDADSSQHSALVDAMAGRNLVVEGPPGTGKSQTISNLIATAMVEGKTVLFVSEKLAALEVVRDRLDRAGLGVFCLELHSHKTQKKRLLEDILLRLKARKGFQPPLDLEAKTRELETRRLRLKGHADLMNSVVHNELGLSVHQVLWAAERHRRALNEKARLLSAEEYSNARACTYEEYERLKEVVGQFEQHFKAIGENPEANPWFGYYPFKLIHGDEPAIAQMIEQLTHSAETLISAYSESRESTGLDLPATQEDLKTLGDQVRFLPLLLGNEALDLLPGIAAPSVPETLQAFERQVLMVRERMPELLRMLSAPLAATQADLDHAKEALREAAMLNQAEAPLPTIETRRRALLALAQEIGEICTFIDETAKGLGIPLQPAPQVVAAVWAAVQAASLAPLDLLGLRRAQYIDPTTLSILDEAVKQAAGLRQTKRTLEARFDMNLLPPREELVAALRAFRTSRSLLRVFRADWRRAVRTFRGISLTRQWFLRSAQCEGDLHALVGYLFGKARLEGNAQLRELLGGFFKGIDTDFDAAKRLALWCAHTRKTFEGTSGPLDETVVLGLPADTIAWLASLRIACERQWRVVENLGERLKDIFGQTDTPPVFSLSGTRLPTVQERLLAVAATLGKVGDVLEKHLAAPASLQQLVALIGGALAVTSTLAEIDRNDQVRRLLGNRFQGLDTEFEPIHGVIGWASAVQQASLPEPVVASLLCPEAASAFSDLTSAMDRVAACWQALDASVQAFGKFGTLDWHAWQRGYASDGPGIRDRARRALEGFGQLWAWTGFSRARQRLQEFGLTSLTRLACAGELTGDEVPSAFRYLFHNSIARSILRDHPGLAEFSGIDHGQLRVGFAQLDRDVIQLNGKRCAHVIDQRAQMAPWGVGSGSPKSFTEMSLITHEVQKKRGHVPIRQLVNRAGRALQCLKPCFMMGPLSVAQYLEPGKQRFDVIIMDEASQLRPEEAIGALARGGQMVVVGDPKQLPPTSFFDRFWEGADGDEEREETAVGGMESILDICLARFYPPRTLRWHYRSQHEALIQFSNHHFYDDKLILFPSPYGARTGLGLRHHFISNGLYDNRRNAEEAKCVADAVIQHFLTRPDESLGVATLNIPQRDLIEEELDRRLKLHPQAEEYLDRWKTQGLMPFFVKNLENVQGDERDTIFISTTYGRNRQGVVAQNFGPINQANGWRRLNVLFTRARRRLEIFTSMQASDIIVDSKSSRGVRAFRDYLSYAKDGVIEGPRAGSRPPDSDFEIAVADVLRNAGYDVVPQLGAAWFFIDIAVKSPTSPGEFIAAIECDGATYHSARSVRERDRIRQEILEGLGWRDRIYRIWSTDWFRDPAAQITQLLKFVENAWERAETRRKQERGPVDAPKALVVDEVTESETFCVQVGDWVTYADPKYPGERKRIRIVEGVSDSAKNTAGSHTPLGKALLGASIGDEVELGVEPARTLKVLDID